MLTSCIVFGIGLLVYYTIIQVIFKYIMRVKKNLSIKFLKSVLLVFGIAVIAFGFLRQFEATKELSDTILKSSALLIALATFSCQKFLGNIVSGVVMSLSKPFDVGDKIIVKSGGTYVCEGVVTDINIRHTIIRQSDGKCSLIPNDVLDEMIIVNNHTTENNGYSLEMECSYDSDVDLAIRLMSEEIKNNELTINTNLPQNRVLCTELSPNGFKLKATIWTENLNDNYLACSQLRLSIYKIWKENGIEIPYKTITVKEDKL